MPRHAYFVGYVLAMDMPKDTRKMYFACVMSWDDLQRVNQIRHAWAYLRNGVTLDHGSAPRFAHAAA